LEGTSFGITEGHVSYCSGQNISISSPMTRF
jgi:hypothetical protein